MAYLTTCHCPKCNKTFEGAISGNESIMQYCIECTQVIEEEKYKTWRSQFMTHSSLGDNIFQEQLDVERLLKYLYNRSNEKICNVTY